MNKKNSVFCVREANYGRSHKKAGVIMMLLVFCVGLLSGCTDIAPLWDSFWEDNGDMEIVRERLVSDLYDGSADPAEIIAASNQDGSFANVDYSDNNHATWTFVNHLKNIVKLQQAAYTENNIFYKDAQLIATINQAIRYWVDNNFVCTWNGWWNGLGTGEHLGNILLFKNEGLEQSYIDWIAAKIYNASCFTEKRKYNVKEREISSTGGNLTDKVMFSMKYAVVKRDGGALLFLKKLMENEMKAFPEKKFGSNRSDVEGIKADMSFQQHFELLYFGGYGEVLCNGFNFFIEKTAGTQFALGENAMNFYQDFLLDGMQFAMRGIYRDINASGRGIVRKDELKGIHNQVTEGCIQLLDSGVKMSREAELIALLRDRNGVTDSGAGGHKYFWNSDYQAYNDTGYTATVRAASKRTKNSESLNGENILGHYLGAGATMYYIKGDEYYNIPPIMNWNRVPGTTSRQGYLPVGGDETYSKMGKTSFVGGISSGSIGMSCMDYNDSGVSAKKAWFMFESGVVCLGADIESCKKENVYTNINQTLFRGKIAISVNGQVTESDTANYHGKADWVYQNGISYLSFAPMEIKGESRTGDWKTISARVASEKYTDSVFEIGIHHGTKPKNARYEYTVLMNADPNQTEEYYHAPSLVVLENTKECQAVMDTKTGIVQMVFWKRGELTLPNGTTIKVDEGCNIIYDSAKKELFVSNPKQIKTTIKVSVAGHKIDAKFERGMYAGAGKKFELR